MQGRCHYSWQSPVFPVVSSTLPGDASCVVPGRQTSSMPSFGLPSGIAQSCPWYNGVALPTTGVAQANDAQGIEKLISWQADYIGLGPLRFTDTKQNLSPILGFEGYEDLLKSTGVKIPIIAIGGVNTQDISALKAIGIFGVAIASGISTAENPSEVVATFHEGFIS